MVISLVNFYTAPEANLFNFNRSAGTGKTKLAYAIYYILHDGSSYRAETD